MTNKLGPVQLQWSVAGEFGNGLGLRGTANVFAPGLPFFGGITAGTYYGADPLHIAGQRNSGLTRFFLGRNMIEARAGVDHARWFRQEIEGHYDYGFVPGADGGTSFHRASYELGLPAYGRRGVYAGVRYNEPNGVRCPDDGSLPEDCADVSPLTLIGGVSLFYATDAEVQTRSHGRLHFLRHRLIELRVLYTPEGPFRRTLASRLGGEVLVTYGGTSNIVVLIGAGWDGDIALLTLGMGGGRPHSFVGRVPAADRP